jgi:hypothetical protein
VVIAATGFERDYLAYNCDRYDGPYLYRYILKPEVPNCASIGFIQIPNIIIGFNMQAV